MASRFTRIVIQSADDASAFAAADELTKSVIGFSQGESIVVEQPATPERITEVQLQVAEKLEFLAANKAVNG